MNRLLNLESIKNMSIDEKMNLYRQGYKLTENYELDIHKQKNMISLNPSTCPSSIIRGTTKNINISLLSIGTAPYVYKLYVDGILKQKYPTTGTTTSTSYIFAYTFNENIGSHIVKGEIIDSCSPEPITEYDQCIVNILSEACPEGEMKIPILEKCYPEEYIIYGAAGILLLMIMRR